MKHKFQSRSARAGFNGFCCCCIRIGFLRNVGSRSEQLRHGKKLINRKKGGYLRFRARKDACMEAILSIKELDNRIVQVQVSNYRASILFLFKSVNSGCSLSHFFAR